MLTGLKRQAEVRNSPLLTFSGACAGKKKKPGVCGLPSVMEN
jgi:hypothetical protein